MDWPTITGKFLIAWVAVLGVYAALSRLAGGPEATVSVVFAAFGREFPIVPFLFGLTVGLLAAHWWPLRGGG